MFALIGGYGLEKILTDASVERHEATFEDEKIHGKAPSFEIYKGKIGSKDIAVIPRHGAAHDLPPHNVPYKSMFLALKRMGVDAVITVNSVGIMNPEIKKGSFILLRDFVNFGREVTFFERFDGEAMHASMSEPYDSRINAALEKAIAKAKAEFHPEAVYVNSHGPRLETVEEIKRVYSPSGDVIGMTGAYEAILARELDMRIASICIGANYAEGCGEKADFSEIKGTMQSMQGKLFEILNEAIRLL